MNPIKKAVDEVRFAIPTAILERAFLRRYDSWRAAPRTSLDEQIIMKVIRARVMIDCNLIGGTQALVDLSGLPQERPADYLTLIHIPKERTEGKSINSVLHVGFTSLMALAGWTGMSSNNALASYGSFDNTASGVLASGLIAAFDKIPMTSTAKCDLVSENTIVVRDAISLPPSILLRCVLANDDDMTNLSPRAYRHFAELVTYAVKAYIYNTLVVNIDQAELQGGQQLGTFKDLVDGYADSNQNYLDYLQQSWEAVAFMADDVTYSRYIQLVAGGYR